MRRKLYELALWYIGRCNKKWDSTGTGERVKKLKRLTYRSGTDKKAYLVYGAAREGRNAQNTASLTTQSRDWLTTKMQPA